MSNVYVVDEWSGPNPGDHLTVVAKFNTVSEAEQFIGELPNVDEVEDGRYGIDA